MSVVEHQGQMSIERHSKTCLFELGPRDSFWIPFMAHYALVSAAVGGGDVQCLDRPLRQALGINRKESL